MNKLTVLMKFAVIVLTIAVQGISLAQTETTGNATSERPSDVSNAQQGIPVEVINELVAKERESLMTAAKSLRQRRAIGQQVYQEARNSYDGDPSDGMMLNSIGLVLYKDMVEFVPKMAESAEALRFSLQRAAARKRALANDKASEFKELERQKKMLAMQIQKAKSAPPVASDALNNLKIKFLGFCDEAEQAKQIGTKYWNRSKEHEQEAHTVKKLGVKLQGLMIQASTRSRQLVTAIEHQHEQVYDIELGDSRNELDTIITQLGDFGEDMPVIETPDVHGGGAVTKQNINIGRMLTDEDEAKIQKELDQILKASTQTKTEKERG